MIIEEIISEAITVLTGITTEVDMTEAEVGILLPEIETLQQEVGVIKVIPQQEAEVRDQEIV